MTTRKLLAVLLFLGTCVFSAYAQTDFTINTYNATSTTASTSTVRTSAAPGEGITAGAFTTNTYNATSTTASAVASLGPTNSVKEIAMKVYETTVASNAMQTGVLYFAWNPENTSMVYYYKDATGTCRVASFPTVWKTMP